MDYLIFYNENVCEIQLMDSIRGKLGLKSGPGLSGKWPTHGQQHTTP